MTITSRAIAWYLKSEKDTLFENNTNDKDFLGTMIVFSYRNRDNIDEFMLLYSKCGDIANVFTFPSIKLPIQTDITTNSIANVMKPVKYGCVSDMIISFIDGMQFKYEPPANDIPEKSNQFYHALTMSNFIGSKEPMLVGNNEYLTRFHASTVVDQVPFLITFVTYFDVCQVSFMTDNRYIRNPKLLKQCWYQEWDKCCQY